jgi:hypothetical protein
MLAKVLCLMKQPPLKYIHLKAKTFAQYDIKYHINDCYSVKQIISFHGNDQLLFQKFENRIQQMNLVIVDSIFPILLADVAIETLLGRVSSFAEYVNLRKEYRFCTHKHATEYLNYKFRFFINYLLFSNISTQKVCNGDIRTDIVYYWKKENKELEYFTIYDQHKLQDILLQKMKLKINFKKSFISDREANLNLQLSL